MGALLSEHGFKLERDISGFPTAFLATYGQGSPVVAIHTEYDANPTNSQQSGVPERAEIVPGAPGHCEGHNVNGAVMVVAAIALRYAMEQFRLPGTLKIFGAPAEERCCRAHSLFATVCSTMSTSLFTTTFSMSSRPITA